MNDKQLRFQELEIWKRAAEFSSVLFPLTDEINSGKIIGELEQESRMLLAFMRSLRTSSKT